MADYRLPNLRGRHRGEDARIAQREADSVAASQITSHRSEHIYSTFSHSPESTQHAAFPLQEDRLYFNILNSPRTVMELKEVRIYVFAEVGNPDLDVALYYFDYDDHLLRMVQGSHARWAGIAAAGRFSAAVDCEIRPRHEPYFIGLKRAGGQALQLDTTLVGNLPYDNYFSVAGWTARGLPTKFSFDNLVGTNSVVFGVTYLTDIWKDLV